MTSARWDVSYPPDIYDDVTPPPPAATGAVAGVPGTWTPPGSTPPATLAELLAADPPVVADPAEAWVDGQNVVTTTGGPVYWDGAAWTAGVAPDAEPPDEDDDEPDEPDGDGDDGDGDDGDDPDGE